MGSNGHLAEHQFRGPYVSLGSKADVTLLNFDVRFTPESGHSVAHLGCPLRANSRHLTNTRMMLIDIAG
jgi:hypothetical protein